MSLHYTSEELNFPFLEKQQWSLSVPADVCDVLSGTCESWALQKIENERMRSLGPSLSTLLPSLGAFPFWPDVVQVRAEVCRSSLLERQLKTVL